MKIHEQNLRGRGIFPHPWGDITREYRDMRRKGFGSDRGLP